VIWNRTIDRDVGVVENHLLQDRSLADYRFLDPKDPSRYAGLPGFLAASPDHFRYVSIAYSLYERAWSLRGMEAVMIDVIDRVGRGGGFIIAPSHEMPGDIPLENLVAFIDEVRQG
jgi:hypothetical protein